MVNSNYVSTRFKHNSIVFLLFFAVAFLALSEPAYAQLGETKVIASDGAADDVFGWSVSISGDYAVVGAWEDDNDNGSESGSAYVYMRSGTTWSQQAKLLSSDGAASDNFGISVAISGDIVVVGAWTSDVDAVETGSAYVFNRTGTSWAQEAKLAASDGAAFDEFGFSVSISDGYTIVAAPSDDDDGSASGSAYLFKLNTAPVITSSATASGTEDVAFSYTATATDAENDALTFTFSALSSWLSASGAVVTGTPTEGVTSGSFRVVVSDGSLTNTLDVSITVAAVNDAPVITSSATATGTEDVAFSYTVTATDAEGATITFAFSSLSSWLSASGAVVTGTPTEGVTSGSFRVVVSDGSLTNTLDVSIAIDPINDTFLTELKITPSDGVSGDGFGGSISISGNYAIIGSPFADDNGSFSGSAYVFKRTGTSWAQQAKLLPSDGAAGDEFGISVAISGDYVVVGADGDADNGSSSGSAYLFKRTGTGWAQQAKLLPSDGASGHKFGGSVSISGDYAVVSSVFDDDNGSFSGSAYVFKRSDIAWAQQAKLLASDGASGDEFGRSVSISGDYVLVGTAGDDDNGSGSGSVYTFMRSNTTWTQQNKLLASDGAASDLFGGSVSISGDYAVVGARRDDDNGSSSGSAYVFKLSGTTWVEEAKLLPTAGATEDNFGNSVSISGDFVIIGLNLDEEGTKVGSAYLFERDGTTWTQKDKLLATDGAAHDLYGLSVSISGDLIAIGAIWDNDNGSNSGSVYMYNGILPPSPPVITSSDSATATEDTYFSYIATATDPNGDTPTFSFSSLSIWLTAAGDSVIGTPTEGVTSGSFRIIASDGTLKDTLDVTITIEAVNDAPIVAGIPSITLDEDSTFSFDLDSFVSDSDNDTTEILWTVEILQPGGSAPITKSLEKNSFKDHSSNNKYVTGKTIIGKSSSVKLSIGKELLISKSLNSNKTNLKGSKKNKGNGSRSVIYLVSDGGSVADSIMIEIDSVTHVATITPNADYFAFNIPVLFIATDPDGLSGSDTINITVTPVNDAPMFVDFPDSVVIVLGEVDTLILSEYAFDIDDPDSVLIWSTFDCIGADSIACVTMSADTAFIQTIGNLSGTQELTFLVTDTSGAADTVSVIIDVRAPIGIVNEGLIPMEYSLSNNYPNPFNPSTTISYGLPQQSDLSLIIYNIMGQEIMRWDEQNSQAGFYQKIWNGRNKFGVPVVSGVYFYRIIAGDFVQTKKMVLLK